MRKNWHCEVQWVFLWDGDPWDWTGAAETGPEPPPPIPSEPFGESGYLLHQLARWVLALNIKISEINLSSKNIYSLIWPALRCDPTYIPEGTLCLCSRTEIAWAERETRNMWFILPLGDMMRAVFTVVINALIWREKIIQVVWTHC